MKYVIASLVVSGFLIAVPIAASADTNTSAAIQQAFLAQLQSLAQELAAMTKTIDAMIVASGGIPPSEASSTYAVSLSRPAAVSTAVPAAVSSDASSGSGDDLTGMLEQIYKSATRTASATSSAASAKASQPSSAGTPAIQMDPSCTSGIYGIGQQCGGLYFCGSSVAQGYWSSTACR